MQRHSAAEALRHLAASPPQTLFGISVWVIAAPVSVLPASNDGPYRVALLPVPGPRPCTVAVACVPGSAKLLASLMFGCPLRTVEASVAEDALCEVSNIVAGQMKSVLAPDQALGLPRVEAADGFAEHITDWRAAKLKKGDKELRLWIGACDRVA
jgi:hypothetical protein